MKFAGCLLALLLCCSGAAFADEEGFVDLFNGKDLDDWSIQGGLTGFDVVDGVIRSETNRYGRWLYYNKKEFSDFVLKVEWRIAPKGNAGVYIRAPKLGNPTYRAYEVQISCEDPPREDLKCTGSLFSYVPPNPRPEETPEIWRTFEITCQGTMITVKLDGEQVVEHDQSTNIETKMKPLKGLIGIQDAYKPGTWVEYRSVKIKELETTDDTPEPGPGQ